MRRIIAALAIFVPVCAHAAPVDLGYENFYRTQTGAVEIVLRFTNNTHKTLSIIAAQCALLGKNKKALTVIPVIVQNVRPGQSAFGNNFGPRHLQVEHAECRILDYD